MSDVKTRNVYAGLENGLVVRCFQLKGVGWIPDFLAGYPGFGEGDFANC